MDSKASLTKTFKDFILGLGFDAVGISKVRKLEEEEDHLSAWLTKNYQGQMHYMSDHFDKRLDPAALVPNAKSVISLLYNYYPAESINDGGMKIARYAYGKDYHKVIKKKLKAFSSILVDKIPEVNHRIFVDSAPVMERQWARESGLGWLGKNTLLINKEKGSYFFLAEIVLDVELEHDLAIKDHCGTCTACLDACPTDAFPQPYVLDASKCISYLTIELKEDQIPVEFKGKMNDWMFGCDICQEVCPWNRFSNPHQEPSFAPNAHLNQMKDQNWKELTEEKFDEIFEGSAVKRTKFKGLSRNIQFLKD